MQITIDLSVMPIILRHCDHISNLESTELLESGMPIVLYQRRIRFQVSIAFLMASPPRELVNAVESSPPICTDLPGC